MATVCRSGTRQQTIVLTLDDAIDLIVALGNAIGARKTRASNRKLHKEMSQRFSPPQEKDARFSVTSFCNSKPERIIHIDLLDVVDEEAPDAAP